jgi:hypothetical protein
MNVNLRSCDLAYIGPESGLPHLGRAIPAGRFAPIVPLAFGLVAQFWERISRVGQSAIIVYWSQKARVVPFWLSGQAPATTLGIGKSVVAIS